MGVDPATTAWVHAPYLLYYPLVLGGLWSFGEPFKHRAERHRLVLDLVTTGTAAAVILSHYLWSPGHRARRRHAAAARVPDRRPHDVHRPVVDRHPAAGGPPPRRAACAAGRHLRPVPRERRLVRAGGARRVRDRRRGRQLLGRRVRRAGGRGGRPAPRGRRRRRAPRRKTTPRRVPLHPLPFAAAAFVCGVLILECAVGHDDAPVDLAVGVTVIAATIAGPPDPHGARERATPPRTGPPPRRGPPVRARAARGRRRVGPRSRRPRPLDEHRADAGRAHPGLRTTAVRRGARRARRAVDRRRARASRSRVRASPQRAEGSTRRRRRTGRSGWRSRSPTSSTRRRSTASSRTCATSPSARPSRTS